MAQLKIYDYKGKEVGKASLNAKIFNVKENQDLVHRTITSWLSSQNKAFAHTKTKDEVSGGGRKPWRQKGTGRARVGSNRSPIWRGGGITFGPRKEKNNLKIVSKKVKKQALFISLSNKAKTGKMILLDKIKIEEIKTKNAEKFLEKLPIKEGNILLVAKTLDPKLWLSFSNLPYLKLVKAENLIVFDVLKYNTIVILKDALEQINKMVK